MMPKNTSRSKYQVDREEGRATIFNLTDQALGEGVRSDDAASVVMPFVLPGETVDFECHTFKKRRKYFPKKIISESPDRTTAACRHFMQCGGCMMQHFGERLYKEFKSKLITDALIAHGLDPFLMKGLVVVPAGRRRRANMDIIKKPDGVHFGFHRYQSHQVIHIDECHTMVPSIVAVLPLFRDALDQILNLYEKAKVFFTETAVGLDVSLEIQGLSQLSPEQRGHLLSFAKAHRLARLIFKYRKTVDVIHQEGSLPFVEFDGVAVEVDAYSFLQASKDTDGIFLTFVMQHMASFKKPLRILDLFCGRGTLTFPLSRYGDVIGYEADKNAVAALMTAYEKTPQDERHTVQAHYRDLFNEPLLVEELKDFDVIMMNPPRAGAMHQAEQLSKSSAQLILYVSCNPETFSRDAALIEKEGHYQLESVEGLDQFAWSAHVEVMAVFKKRSK